MRSTDVNGCLRMLTFRMRPLSIDTLQFPGLVSVQSFFKQVGLWLQLT
jgi:hypothetical protein